MINSILKFIFGTKNQRILKQYEKIVAQINQKEQDLKEYSDAQLQELSKTLKVKAQSESLDSLIVEAFALVREASSRVLNMRHFDVQLIGGLALHNGNIAEMRTGEGKTLVATLPAYLNALSGKGVHVITVNDYLANRDGSWMRPLFEFLDLSVGIVTSKTSKDERIAAYKCDITYGTNNEYGFDYLRDNMVYDVSQLVQRELNYCIIDEIDSILIDEARTPLIISGPVKDSTKMYQFMIKLVAMLHPQKDKDDESGHFLVDLKSNQVVLSEEGNKVLEAMLNKQGLIQNNESLYAPQNINLLHYINACLKALHLYKRNFEYVIQEGKVVIVDENTGRTMPGRRWSEGIHQAIEAKENVKIEQENQSLASITYQNYFKLYKKLSGMTGTADTEAQEFSAIYDLDVIVIPTNKPIQRKDENDIIFFDTKAKYAAITEDVKKAHSKLQPVMVGTASIESSESLSKEFKKAKLPHNVLNAKYHEKEAEIVSRAGMPGAITIATNMAGRGTDIKLGGNLADLISKHKNPTEKEIETIKAMYEQDKQTVINAGGLRIIGSEKHESRRIDNQLRGRSGRQGDPGSTKFYLSFDDRLMKTFGEKAKSNMKRVGLKADEALESGLFNRVIASAQKKAEGRNFDSRKQVLEFDNIANDHRKIIYSQRSNILKNGIDEKLLHEFHQDVALSLLDQYVPPKTIKSKWLLKDLDRQVQADFMLGKDFTESLQKCNTDKEVQNLLELSIKVATTRPFEHVDSEIAQRIQREVFLNILDQSWREHLLSMDHLRSNIHLRAYAQKDPKQEYKREAFYLFENFLDTIKHNFLSFISRLQLQEKTNEESQPAGESIRIVKAEGSRKMRRNELCFCKSGKKYKHCHGSVK